MAFYGVSQQFGLADDATSIGGFHTVIGIVEINSHYIHIEREIGKAHNHIDHAWTDLPIDQCVGTVCFSVNYNVGSSRKST